MEHGVSLMAAGRRCNRCGEPTPKRGLGRDGCCFECDLKKATERDAARVMYRHFKRLLNDDLFEVRYSEQGGCPGCYQALYDYEDAAGITQ